MNKIILSLICSKAAPKPDAEADSQFLAAVTVAAPLAAVPVTLTVATPLLQFSSPSNEWKSDLYIMLSLLQMKTRCRRIDKRQLCLVSSSSVAQPKGQS